MLLADIESYLIPFQLCKVSYLLGQWYTSVYTANLQKLTFFMLLRDCQKLTNWKITEILFVLLRVILAILCCIGKTNPRGKVSVKILCHPGMNTEPKSLSSSVICKSDQNNHWCVHYISDLVAKSRKSSENKYSG